MYLQLAEEASSGDLSFPNKCRGAAARTGDFHQRTSSPSNPHPRCQSRAVADFTPSGMSHWAKATLAPGIPTPVAFSEGTRWLIVTVGLGLIFFFHYA